MAKKKTEVVPALVESAKPADISDLEMADSELLRKLNTKLRQEHNLNLAEALNDLLRRFGHGVNLRD